MSVTIKQLIKNYNHQGQYLSLTESGLGEILVSVSVESPNGQGWNTSPPMGPFAKVLGFEDGKSYILQAMQVPYDIPVVPLLVDAPTIAPILTTDPTAFLL